MLKQDVFVWTTSYFGGSYYLSPPNSAAMPATVQAWEALSNAAKQDLGVVGIVRAGTRLRIQKLISDLDSGDPYHPFAIVLDGQYRGKTVHVDDLLDRYDPNSPSGGWLWHVREEYLAPCTGADESPLGR